MDRKFSDAQVNLAKIAGMIELKEGDSGTELDAMLNAIDEALATGADAYDRVNEIRSTATRLMFREGPHK